MSSKEVRGRSYDPTRTTTLRNMFVRDVNRRFVALRRAVKKKIVDEDCFGLKKSYEVYSEFDFPLSKDKSAAFMYWIREQEKYDLLEVSELRQVGTGIDPAWTNKYVIDSYNRGVSRAQYEATRAGYDAPLMTRLGDTREILKVPAHLDRVGVLCSRVFADLTGITSQMDTQISRVLGIGLVDGDNPIKIARDLDTVISGSGDTLAITDKIGRFIPAQRRAQMLARTEIIRAHHQGMIQEYTNWGLEGVVVLAEIATARDGRVCDKCKNIDGKTYSLEDVFNIIPLHPNCRCIALPVKKEAV